MHRVFLLFVLAGCASAPSAFSARSAASPESAAAPRVTIGRALTEEPPAPGASTEGWAGFAGAPAADPMAGMHHHHHPGMVMPEDGGTHAP
jgi:hypothetical protein